MFYCTVRVYLCTLSPGLRTLGLGGSMSLLDLKQKGQRKKVITSSNKLLYVHKWAYMTELNLVSKFW